jgi:glutamate racemase
MSRLKHIATFDSGIGGLTTLPPLFRNYPDLHVTHFGDLANLPYGTKSPERIQELTAKNIEWLLSQKSPSGKNFDLLLIACNTASAHALPIAQKIAQSHHVPCVGVIEAGCRAAIRSKRNRVVVLATQATVQSQVYLQQLTQLGSKVPTLQKACPLFVPLVEENVLSGPATEWVIHHYLDDVLEKDDAVILGCTHYPFLVPALTKIYPQTQWIDAGAALVFDQKVIQVLGEAQPSAQLQGTLKVLLSDKSASFDRLNEFIHALKLDGLHVELEYSGPAT